MRARIFDEGIAMFGYLGFRWALWQLEREQRHNLGDTVQRVTQASLFRGAQVTLGLNS